MHSSPASPRLSPRIRRVSNRLGKSTGSAILPLAASIASALILSNSPAAASTITFTGTGTTWNQGADWSSGLTPQLTDDLLFSAAAATTLDASFSVQSLSFNTPGSGAVSIDANSAGTSGRTLTLTGDITGNDALGNTGMLLDLGNSMTGTVNIGTATGVGTTTVALGASGAFNIANAGATLNFGANSVISGAFNLSQTGAGTLILAGANTFGGTGNSFTLASGTLDLNNASALGNAANAFVINGGTIDNTSGAAITTSNYAQKWTGSFTFNGTNALNLGAGAVTLTASPTITVNGTGALTVGGVISGTGFGLTKAGTNTLVLTGANTYNGGTTISNGTLQIGNGVSNGTVGTGTYSIGGGARLYLNQGASPVTPAWANLSGAGTLELNDAASGAVLYTQLALPAGFSGSLVIDNHGRVNGGPSNLGSATSVVINGNSQFLAYDGTSNSLTFNQAFSLSGLGSESGQAFGALRVSTVNATFAGPITLTGNTGFYLQNHAGGAMTVSGVISDGGNGYSLAINNQFTNPITLSGANTYTGATSLNQGTLKLSNSLALQSSALKMAGGTLVFDSSVSAAGFTVGGLSGTGNITLTDNATTPNPVALTLATAGTQTYSGALSGAGSLIVSGPGTQMLTGSNTYTGTTTVNSGTLELSTTGALTASSITIGHGTLQIDSTGKTLNALTLNDPGAAISIVAAAGQTTTITNALLQSSNYTITPVFLTAPTVGTINLFTAGSISGSGIPTLNLSVYGASRLTGTLGVSGNTLQLNITSGPANLLWSNGTNSGNWNVAGDSNFTNNGSPDVFKSYDAVTFDNTATPGTVTLTGNLAPSSVTVKNTSGNYTFSGTGSLVGPGTLTKSGTGTLTIQNANTYIGGTTLNAGQLNINNSQALGTGTLTVAGGVIDNTSGSAVTLTSNNAQTWSGSFTFNGTNPLNLGTGAITLTANPTVTVNGAGQTVAGAITGTGFGLTKTGNATLTLTGANTYTGSTTVANGRLTVTNIASYRSNTTVNSGTTFEANVASGTQTVTANYNFTGTGTVQKTGTGTWAVGASGLHVNFNMSAGGLVDIEGGTVQNNYVGASWGSNFGSVNIASGAILDLYAENGQMDALTGAGTLQNGYAPNGVKIATLGISNGSGTFSGVISSTGGNLSIIKAGTGVEALAGANTYGGTTTINAGTLALDFSVTGAPASNIINNSANNSALVLGGGTLQLKGGSTAANTQRFNGLTLNPSASAVQLVANGKALLLTLGTITRSGGTVDFTQPAGTISTTNGITTTSGTASTLLTDSTTGGAYATVGGTDWAAISATGGNIVGLSTLTGSNGYTAFPTAGTVTLTGNADLTTGTSGATYTLAGNSSPTTIREIGTAANISIPAGMTLSSSGILSNQTMTISGSGTLMAGGGGSAGELVVNQTANTSTINAVIGDNGSSLTSLTKSGAGTLTLTAANTYSGPTTLDAGTLNINNASALGNAGANNIFTIGAGTIDNTSGAAITTSNYAQKWAGNFTFTGSNALNLGTGAVTLTATPTITVSGSGLTVGGAISGTGFGLTKAGNAPLTLTGTNTYSGPTTVSTGTLTTVNPSSADGNGNGGWRTSAISIASGATLQFALNTGGWEAPNNGLSITGAGTLKITGNNTLRLGGQSTGYATTVSMSQGGLIDVEGGTLELDYATSYGAWANNKASMTIASGAIFDVWDYNNGILPMDALNGGGTIQRHYAGTGINIGVAGGSGNFSGVIQNGNYAMNVVKSGAGTQVLSGSNTYTGTTTINGGTLEFAGNGLPSASAMTVNAGTLQIDTAGKTLMTLAVNDPSAGLVLPAISGQTTTVTGTFTASANYSVTPLFATLPTAGLTFNLLTAAGMAGSGTPTLNPNTPFGPTRVTGSLAVVGNTLQYTVATGAATLVWNNHAATGTWNVATDANFNNGGSNDVFKVYDAVTFDDSTSAGGTVTLAGLLAPSSVTVNTANSYTFAGSGSISGAGTLTKNGTGVLTIGAANNYGGGTTLNAGQINLNNASAIGAGTFNIAGGVIENTSGHAITLASNNPQTWSGDFTFGGSNALNLGRGAVTLTANRTLTVNGSLTVGGAISGTGFGLTKTGPGTLVLTSTSTYTGTTTVSAGTFQLGDGVSSNGSVAGGIANNGTLIFANPTALTYSGVISGTGGVVFSGPGSVTLTTASNTYAGGTTINGTTVNLGSNGNENAAALGTGLVSLGSGGLLWMQPGSTGAAYNIANALNINGGTIRGEDGVQHLQGPVAIGSLGATLQATWGGKDLYVDGVLSGSATLTLSHGTTGGQAAAIHITNANNTYSGTINVSGAGNGVTLDLDNPKALQYASVNLNPGTAGAMLLTNTNGATIAGLTSSSGGSVKPATTAGTYTLTINNSGNFSYAGTLADNTGILALTKTGTGTQTLSGAVTYSGPTIINAGTLALVGSTSLASQAITIAPGGVLDVSGLSSGAFSLGTGQSLTGGKASGNGNDIVGNLSTGSGSLNVSISGTLSLKGDLTLNGGTVNLNLNNSGTGGSGLNDLINAANLNLSGPTSFPINTGTSPLAAGTYTIVQYTGSLSGTTDNLSVLLDGSPVATTRANCAVGTTAGTNGALTLTVAGSTASLVWAGDGATNAWDVTATSNFLNNGARDMFYQADAVTFDDSGSNSPSVAITGTVNPGSVVVNNSATPYTFGGTGSISGPATLTKSGNGTLTITNANTYTGGTTLNAGQLNINNALALGTGPLVVAGGTIDNTSGAPITLTSNNPQTWTGNFTFGGSNALNLGTGAVSLGTTTTVTVNGDSTTPLTVGGPISGTYGLTKEGPGTLALTSNGNSYTGNVTVNGGILQTGTRQGNGTTGSLGANYTTGRTITVNSGAQLQFLINNVFGGGSQPLANIPAVIINGGTVSSTNYNIIGNVTLNSGATLTQSATTSGSYQGWEFSKGSTVTVGGTSGSTISNTGTAGDHLDQAMTFNVASTGDTAPDLTVSVNLLNASGDNGNVAGGFTKTGAGTMLLSAANTYTGPTIVNGGMLQVGGSIAGTAVTVNNGGTLVVAGTASGSSATVSGGTLSIPTGGTLSDTLTVNSGTVQVAGSLSGSTAVVNGGSLIGAQGGTIGSAVTVSGGLLGGQGVVSGAVTVNSGGTVAPGQNASGYLTLNNGLALNSGGHLALALDGTGFTAQYAPAYVTGGTVALGGDLQLTLGYAPTIGDVFFVILNQGPSAISGIFSNAADQGNGTGLLSAGGYNFLVSYTASYGSGAFGVNQGQDVALEVIAIPEPGAAIALLSGLGTLPGLQRFRRRKAVKNL